jgi:O-antigen/teichoic acid export membrane protein
VSLTPDPGWQPADAPAVPVPWPRPAPSRAFSATRSFIRGSSLLLTGRAISLSMNFGVQVLTVRYLSKSDYGAFAYALGIASMGAAAVLLGLHRTIPRFVPIYRERGEYRKMFGAIALAALTVAGLGLSLVALLHGLQGVLLGRAVTNPLSLALLLVLIALTPIEALDHLFQGLLATFAGAKAIFFRRYLLAPGLRLAALLFVLASAGDVRMLAYGYVVGGAIGVATYALILLRTWTRQGLLDKLRTGGIEMPAREIFGYCLPLLSTELFVVLNGAFVLVLLELLQTTEAVAEFRAILPVARANLVVLSSFSMLFIPVASTLFARGDREGINDLFWQTATWTAVLTFPLLLATTLLAEPLVVLLFGAKYAGSGGVLAILAVGFYVHAALGANTQMLRVCGTVRYLVITDVAAVAVGSVLHFVLILRFGALGAAAASSATLILHNLLHQSGLWLGGTGVRLIERRYLRVYLAIGAGVSVLGVLQHAVQPPLFVTLPVAVLACLAVLRLARGVLRPDTTFPELLRFPWVRRLFGQSTTPPGVAVQPDSV